MASSDRGSFLGAVLGLIFFVWIMRAVCGCNSSEPDLSDPLFHTDNPPASYPDRSYNADDYSHNNWPSAREADGYK
jgi:hypothetical protein